MNFYIYFLFFLLVFLCFSLFLFEVEVVFGEGGLGIVFGEFWEQ